MCHLEKRGFHLIPSREMCALLYLDLNTLQNSYFEMSFSDIEGHPKCFFFFIAKVSKHKCIVSVKVPI